MYLNQRLHKRISTGLIALFLVLALVPIYMIMAKFSTGGQYVQLCTSNGMQTVWVADDADTAVANASVNSSAKASAGNVVNPFGCCEFCWTSVLAATVLPLIWVLFVGSASVRFSVPAYQTHAFHSYLRRWHVSPRAPPYLFSI